MYIIPFNTSNYLEDWKCHEKYQSGERFAGRELYLQLTEYEARVLSVEYWCSSLACMYHG
jgi:hypothetical protein